jgi:Fur family peroxide stress response transcriptional regulator
MILLMDRRAAAVQGRVDDLVHRCREARRKVTPQRLAIYRALLEAEDHPSPEALFQRVRAALPALSLATVYKVLDALVGLGVVREVTVGGATRRYDANLDHHHHLVCTDCGLVSDYYDAQLDAVSPPRVQGFVTQAVSVQVLGRCGRCARRAKGT